MKLQEAEKKINATLLKIIIGFSFVADSKDEIGYFLKKHAIQIYNHLQIQYQKYKKFYREFKARHKEFKEKNK